MSLKEMNVVKNLNCFQIPTFPDRMLPNHDTKLLIYWLRFYTDLSWN